MKLLSVNADAKTVKGVKKGYLTGILYLAPANTSGYQVCANSTPGCRAACLFTAGRAGCFPRINDARILKTQWLMNDRPGFMTQLSRDICALERKAMREDLIPCVRLNGTSDLIWLATGLAQAFRDIQFYDYTKHPQPWERVRSNYHLTFSYSESNAVECCQALEHGVNVAMVFDVKRGQPLPKTWCNYKVIDGDLSDLRFLDPKGVIVGLRAKGKAKKDTTGFVVIGGIDGIRGR